MNTDCTGGYCLPIGGTSQAGAECASACVQSVTGGGGGGMPTVGLCDEDADCCDNNCVPTKPNGDIGTCQAP